MLKSNALLSAVVVCGMGLASAAHAQVSTVMDGTTNNGSFTINQFDDPTGNGSWANTPSALPKGWTGTPLTGNLGYTQNSATGNPATQHYFTFEGFNNTNVVVTDNTVYSVSANANTTNADMGVLVDVIATENSDGTGNAVSLATAVLTGGTATTGFPNFTNVPPLLPIADDGSATTSAVAGYFVQVRTRAVNQDFVGYYYVDDIVVTATVVPEPASVALLALGGTLMLLKRKRAC